MGILRAAPIKEDGIVLPAPTEAESVVADYSSLGLTLGKRPVAFLRARLRKQRLLTADELNACGDGAIVRACGLVTVRQ